MVVRAIPDPKSEEGKLSPTEKEALFDLFLHEL
jgi:hypothetical protein